ncbi:MAG TPA: PorV/PorQ family protein [Bacteroidota bacterium]|nr:PorV/PorQ family protein [Bacteroidota bacterium]
MMKRILCSALAAALCAGLAPGQSKTGTTVGQFLLIEPSARIGGMGNAGATMYDEIEAAYYNPAAIGHVTASGVQFTHSPWLAGITFDYAGLALTLGNVGNIFASVTALNSGDIAVRTVDQPLGTGENYTVTDFALGVGYGRVVSERFSVGLQVKYLQETIWHSSMSGIALDVGTLYRTAPDGLYIGASIANFGTRPQFDGRDLRILYDQNKLINGDNPAIPGSLTTSDFPLPILFRVGVGLPVAIDQNNRVRVEVDAYHPSDNNESVSAGAEWMFFNTFAVRGGYQNLFLKDSEVGLTLGAGLHYDLNDVKISFDYAWADHGRLDYTQLLTFGVAF